MGALEYDLKKHSLSQRDITKEEVDQEREKCLEYLSKEPDIIIDALIDLIWKAKKEYLGDLSQSIIDQDPEGIGNLLAQPLLDSLVDRADELQRENKIIG